MNQNKDCIICGSSNDLETEIVITVDGEKIIVRVCKEHADDITPKAAKSAYLKWRDERNKQMDEFLKQAAKLGMIVTPHGSITTVSTPTPTPTTTPTPAPVQKPTSTLLQGSREDGILSTSEVDNVMQNRVSGLSGSINGTGIEQHTAYNHTNLADKLPEGARDGLVKMELAEGRHGTPLAIPSIRQDGLGTTRISIAKTMTDADLQKRFKQQALDDRSFVDGYDFHRCSICNGEGQIAKSKTEIIICPKCKGSGLA